MNLSRSIATVGSLTMVSRIFGFARDILIASTLGAGLLSDAFFVAFKIPNFFRRLFAEGAFNAAFVPLFSGLMTTDGRDAARAFAGQVLAVMLVTLFIFVTAMQILMPWVMYGLAPGFVTSPEKFDLTVELTRLTFPYLLFISLVSLMGGILNSAGRFAAAAATPILLNTTLIGALLFAAPYLPTEGHALAWGVAVAGMVQFAWLMVASHRAGLSLRLPRPRLTPRVRQLLWLMLPGVIGAGVVQINLLADIVIASLLPEGSISFLYFADRVTQLPLGVIGVAVGTALLPLLSRHVAAGNEKAAANSQNRAIETALLFTLPAAAALLVISPQIVTTLFERGAFDATTSAATAAALMAYSAGLPAYVLIKVLTPGYFARKDTKTPVKIAVVSMVVNLALNLILMGPLLHVGLALATAISAWLNVVLLAIGLRRRGYLAMDSRLTSRMSRVAISAAVMAVALWGIHQGLAEWSEGSNSAGIFELAILVMGGALVFGVAAQITGAARFSELRGLLGRNRTPPTAG